MGSEPIFPASVGSVLALVLGVAALATRATTQN
jgi:hypothetical protein